MNVQVKVQSLGLDRSSNTPVVILREVEGERVLPIWIGPGEASAIAMHLADMKFSRPLTHDLVVSVLRGLGGTLDRAVITRVTDATFFAELVVKVGGREVVVDARPSDSIAVALRAGARLFANEALLERASIELSEEDEISGGGGTGGASGEGEPDVESPFPWDWPDPAGSPGAPGSGKGSGTGSGSSGGQGKGAGSGPASGKGSGAGSGSSSGSGPGKSSGTGSGKGPSGTSGPVPMKGPRPMGPEELKEYLRKLNPEDFGRFTP